MAPTESSGAHAAGLIVTRHERCRLRGYGAAPVRLQVQAEFATLFRDLLERAYLTQMEAAGGAKITFLSEAMEAGGSAIVRSRVTTRQGSEIPVDYRMHVRDGTWRIYDLLVQGISFTASYRTQFDRVVRAESYSSLRERLQKKAAGIAGQREASGEC